MKTLLLFFVAAVALLAQTDSCECTFSCTTQEMVISAERIKRSNGTELPFSIEERISYLSGIQLVNRGRMAKEILIRGMADGPVTTTIDGISLHGACVDKMDPVSSYLENDNLEKVNIEADAVSGVNAGGTAGNVNLITEKAKYEIPLSLRTENIFSFNDNGIKNTVGASYGSENLAIRAGFTFRQAGNFRTGDATVIERSGYRKRNLSGNILYQISEGNELSGSFIGDYANDVKYPPLLMDARTAKAEIFSIVYSGDNWGVFSLPIQLKWYKTNVAHQMDDFGRPVSEVISRKAMPGMYMPMTGTYNTQGIQLNTSLKREEILLSLNASLSSEYSVGDMKMISLFPGVPEMFLYNIGGASIKKSEMGIAAITAFTEESYLRIGARVGYSDRTLEKKEAIAAWSGYKTGYKSDKSYLYPSISAEYSFWFDSWMLTGAVSYASREPLLQESYGYFVFNPLEEAYQRGNIDLSTEKSIRFSLAAQCDIEDFTINLKAYSTNFSDYILSAITGDSIGFGAGRLAEKEFRNLGLARVIGAELNASYTYNQQSVTVVAGIQSSRSLYFNDVLPFQPRTQVQVHYTGGSGNFSYGASISGIFRQEKVSTVIAKEIKKVGYVLVSADCTYEVTKNFDLVLSVINLTNQQYTTGFGIYAMPEPGTETRIGFRYSTKGGTTE